MLIGIQASWSVTACLWPLPVMWLRVSQGVGLTINRENWVRTSSASPAATDTNINQVPRELSWECKFTFMKLAEVCWSLPCIPKCAKSSRQEREWGGKENKRKNRYDHHWTKFRSTGLHAVKRIYWHQVVIKQSAMFIVGNRANNSGQLVLKKQPKLPSVFQKSTLKGLVREEHPRLYDELVHNSLTGCWWGSRVVTQTLILSILRWQ